MEGGLRERKKARTRLQISDVATALFARHGFEQVTVAQVAEAADVSVKTVFNYFATKEDLFFDRADEVFACVVGAVRDRPAGTGVVEALRRLYADRPVPFAEEGWSWFSDPEGLARFRRFVATEHASDALRARRLVVSEAWARRLAPVLAEELGLPAEDRRAEVLAALVLSAAALRERTLAEAVLGHAPAEEVERRVRAVVDEAFGRIAAAFADLEEERR